MRTAGTVPSVKRRALLVFADSGSLDLVRRKLPAYAAQLLNPAATTAACSAFADVHFFTPSHRQAQPYGEVHRQIGRTFGERFENAVATLSALGYDEIVAIGRDCPSLRASDVSTAFEHLQQSRLVLGPDHRGGCYLIAFRAGDRRLVRGVRWNQNTDCADLLRRTGQDATFLLPFKHDVDSWADVRLIARLGGTAAKIALFLIERVSGASRSFAPFFDAAAQLVRVRGQMPPPAFAK